MPASRLDGEANLDNGSASGNLENGDYRKLSDVMAPRNGFTPSTSSSTSQDEESKAEDDEDTRSGCRRCLDSVYPAGFWPELKSMMMLAWPIVLTQVCQMMLGPVSLMFCGHLGDPLKLDGAALGISMVNVTAVSVAQGMGTACDTVFSQSFGSENKKNVGIYLQKAVYVFLLVLLPCYAVHMNLEDFLLVVGQHPAVSRYAGRYLLLFMPGAFFFFMYIILAKYVQNQNIVLPNVVIGILANVVNGVLHYIFLYRYKFGTDGSAVAMSVSYFVMFSLTLLYIIFSKVYVTTWDGWSRRSLEDWGSFVRLAIPGMLMLCMEWWGFEVGVFITGLLGTTELGAQSVLLQIDSIWYQIPLGLQIATAIRVGQHLGACNPVAAKTVARLSITTVVLFSVLPLAMYTGLQYQLPYLFTNVEEIANLTSKLMPIVVIYIFFDSVAGACKGILFGTGRQKLGAILMFVSYYLLALPMGIPLMFLTSLRSAGIWWALAGNLMLQSVVLAVVILRTDWEDLAKKAQFRAGVWQHNNTDIADKSYTTVSEESSNERTAILSSDPTRRYVDGDVSSTSEDATPRPLASLLWRRGLALALMVAIFGAGLACRLFAPRPAGRAASLVDWNVANSSSPPLAINYTTTISS